MMLKPGLYEQIISQSLSRELASVSDACKHVEKLDAAEAPQALAGYVAEAVRAALEAIPSGTEEQSAKRIALVNKVLDVLSQQREDLSDKSVDDRAEKLLQILQENDPGRITGMTAAKMPRPETPMAVSSLFTGAAHEPKMFTELQKEIASADRIDMLVSFVKWSGLRLIIDALREFTAGGGLLRVITTSYMGATEVKAIDELVALPNTEIKVSYDTARTRLHAKTYVLYRDTGFTTAYSVPLRAERTGGRNAISLLRNQSQRHKRTAVRRRWLPGFDKTAIVWILPVATKFNRGTAD